MITITSGMTEDELRGELRGLRAEHGLSSDPRIEQRAEALNSALADRRADRERRARRSSLADRLRASEVPEVRDLTEAQIVAIADLIA